MLAGVGAHWQSCNLGQGYHFSRAVPDYLAAMMLAKERDKEHARQRKAG